jgi:hypothetical protein
MVISRSRSRADGTRRRKSIRQGYFDLSINPRTLGRSVRESASLILPARDRGQPSGYQPAIAVHESTGITATPKTSTTLRCNSKSLLSSVLLHILLFSVCPHSQAIAQGGYRMLLVYGMLVPGMVFIS